MPAKPEPLPEDLLELRVFGSGVVRLGQELKFATRKLLALLTYLVLEGETSRSKLADLFWSDNTEQEARRNLRRELHRLREMGLRDRLEANEEQLRLIGKTSSDVQEFESLLQTENVEAALELYTAELLQGLKLEGALGFETWLEAKRASLTRSRRQAMLGLAQGFETNRDYRAALNLNLRLLEEDPLHERLHREVMRLQYLLGEREVALTQFERCKLTLWRELGLEPLPETLQLEAQIRAAQSLEFKVATPPVAAQGWVIPFIGREAVLAQLTDSQARLKLLLGEAGVGKTRVLDEFSAHGLRVRFRQVSSQIPFYAVAQTIREAMSRPEAQSRFDQLELVWRREAARLVPELLSRRQTTKSNAEDRSRFLEGLARTLECLSAERLIVFDDLHWADNSSLELIAHLIHKTSQPLELLASARQYEITASTQTLLDSLAKDGLLKTIQVGALDELSTLELVRVLSGRVAPLFAARLYATTAGNPFFTLETIRHLFERGELEIRDGFWVSKYDDTTTDYLELPIPPNVRKAVLERVNHLGAAANRLLETATLTDAGFTLSELQPATALSEWEGVAALESAVSAQVLIRFETGYRFNHDLTRKALEDSLSPERKRLIHQKLAISLESLAGNPARIAAHLELAGKPDHALPWRIKAAQSARSVYAHREALTHYQHALEDGAAPEQVFEIRLARALIFQTTFDYSAAEAELQSLEQTRGVSDQSKRLNIAWIKLLYSLDRFPETLQKITPLLEVPLLESERALILQYQGSLLYRLGQLEEAEVCLRSAIELAKTHAPELLAINNVELGYLLLRRGKLEPAEALILEALRLTEPWQRKHAVALNAQARLALVLGQHERVVQSLEQALSIAYKLDDNDLAFSFLSNLLRVHLEQGNLDDAQIRLHEGLRRFQGLHPRAESYLTRRQSELSYLRGDLGAAVSTLKASIQMADQLSENNQRATRRMLLANWLTRLGDVGGSKMLCTELEGLDIAGITQLDCELAHCDIGQGHLETARKRLETALNVRDYLPEALSTISYYLARIYNQLGNPNRSLELSQAQYPSTELKTLNLSVRLEAMGQLGQSTRLLEGQAWKLLQDNPPPLEGLELCRSLTKVATPKLSQKARLHAQKTVSELSATLEDQMELKKLFLELYRDLTTNL
jgi:DNA-binding SARP family transcriptional activator/predicted ATPase